MCICVGIQNQFLFHAPKAWYDNLFKAKVFQHPAFRGVNSHLRADEYNALTMHGVWPKNTQVFSPYQPSTSGYTQVLVKLPPRGMKVHMALHDVACIYHMRFLKEPASQRLTPKQVEACFPEHMQASHLLENIKPAPMGINPYMMALEVGAINRSRHTCVLANSLQAFLAMHKNDPSSEEKKKQAWHKEIANQHSFFNPVSSFYITFKCALPNMHKPPCMGWDFRPCANGQLPKDLMNTWSKYQHKKHLKKVEKDQEKQRIQHLTRKKAAVEKVQKLKKQLSAAQSRLRSLENGT